MRIIEVVPSLANRSSGLTYAVTCLAEQLRARGHDLTLACVDAVGHAPTPDWVRRFPHAAGSGKLLASPQLRRWLAQAAAAEPRPIIHSHNMWQMPVMYAAWAARQARAPFVVSPHGTLGVAARAQGSRLIKRLMWAGLQRRALGAATCFHATAASEAEEIRALGFRQPIAVIPNGVDMPVETADRAEPAERAENAVRAERRREVLFLGQLRPKKGLDALLRVWSRVQGRFPQWHLRIVGPDDTPYAAQMKALAASLALERVTFAGALVGDARSDAYGRASMFVLPTLNENFGVAVAEALAHATPVIVTKGAPWSGLERHRCGWWIDFGDDALAAALSQAMACPASMLAEMGDRGRRWVQAEFSWVEIGAQMEQLYQWLLAGAAAAERPAFVQVAGS